MKSFMKHTNHNLSLFAENKVTKFYYVTDNFYRKPVK